MLSLGQCFSEMPKLAQRKHVEVVDDGVHEIEGEVLLTLLNITKVEFLAADSRCHCGLCFIAPHTQLCYRHSK